jgi:dTDP-4-dehydrorhamnose reductase
MKILLLGKNGQVGWELQRALAPLGQVYALDRSHPTLCGDLGHLDRLAQTIRELAPNIIVNAAAYTAVDLAESETDLAHQINSLAPQILAREAALLDAWLVHYSSDYVFNGSGLWAWKETDTPAPLNHYGKSKLDGEQAIESSLCKHLIFRTSWVYGAKGNNFVKTMLRLAEERDTLNIVNDQIGAPSGAELLADMTAHALRVALENSHVSGLYHLAPQGETSWYDYAKFVINEAAQQGKNIKVKTIKPILSSDYHTPAQRPCNSRLNTSLFSKTFGLYLPPWELGVKRMINEFLGH